MSEKRENVLSLQNITMQFGGVVAVNDLSLEVGRGEIVALIGPNGAGKTTAFNCVTGVYQPTNGEISFEGKAIVRNHPQGKMKNPTWARTRRNLQVTSLRRRRTG